MNDLQNFTAILSPRYFVDIERCSGTSVTAYHFVFDTFEKAVQFMHSAIDDPKVDFVSLSASRGLPGYVMHEEYDTFFGGKNEG